jgi:hypothetical protein
LEQMIKEYRRRTLCGLSVFCVRSFARTPRKERGECSRRDAPLDVQSAARTLPKSLFLSG